MYSLTVVDECISVGDVLLPKFALDFPELDYLEFLDPVDEDNKVVFEVFPETQEAFDQLFNHFYGHVVTYNN